MCARDAIRLRVVLPWDAPKYAALPAGPEYTVMCYNLFGYHSGPGPKADVPFLTETCALYQNQPYTTRMAFANGGFAWRDSGISALTQTEAEALAAMGCQEGQGYLFSRPLALEDAITYIRRANT